MTYRSRRALPTTGLAARTGNLISVALIVLGVWLTSQSIYRAIEFTAFGTSTVATVVDVDRTACGRSNRSCYQAVWEYQADGRTIRVTPMLGPRAQLDERDRFLGSQHKVIYANSDVERSIASTHLMLTYLLMPIGLGVVVVALLLDRPSRARRLRLPGSKRQSQTKQGT